MGVIIGFGSGKGGVGKTTLTMHVGLLLLKEEKKVLLIDSNISASDLSIYLGEIDYEKTFHDVLLGKATMQEVIYEHQSGLHLIPGPLQAEIGKVRWHHVKKHVRSLKESYDYILMDLPPGTDADVMNCVKACDETILVTHAQIPSLSDVNRLIELIKKEEIKIRGVVVNSYKKPDIELTENQINEFFDLPIISVVPEDSLIYKSVNTREPLLSHKLNSKAIRKMKNISRDILGLPQESIGLLTKIKQIFTRAK